MLGIIFVAGAIAAGALATPPGGAAPPLGSIVGRATSAAGEPLAGVRVQITESNRSAVTDQEGRYEIRQLASGVYRLSFTLIGYTPLIRRVRVDTGAVTVDAVLRPTYIELPGLQVTATPQATTPLTSPQPTGVIAMGDLQVAQAPSLGETISTLAGLRSWSTGAGIGKPVIRGLSSNRVLVLDDGQRTENQSWGDEHSSQVETAEAERIEVVRGPASVLYGSDALGGVVNVVPPELPDGIGRPAFARVGATAAYATNNRQPEGSLRIEGASGGLGFRGSVTGRTSDDVRTPAGPLFNSGNRAVGATGSLGTRGAWGAISASYTRRTERVEIHEDPAEDPTATPLQRIQEDRARLDLELPVGPSRAELILGLERNRRREFEADTAADVAVGLLARTYTADLHVHHALAGWGGILGVSGLATTFEKFGEETLIPNNDMRGLGVYGFEQRDAGPWTVSAGLRYDYRRLDVEADTVIGVTDQTRTYHSLAGNIGVVYRVAEPVAVVLNVARGFRAPSAFELFVNGVHEGTVRFERGDSTLKNETSLNTDLALRIQTERLYGEIGAFANVIDNFIYPRPTGVVDSASGFQVFQVVQGDARLLGVEASAEYHPTSFLHLRGSADYVRGENTSTDAPLPWMPPLRVTYLARFEGGGGGWLRAPYVSIGGETHAKQTRLDPDDFAPPGYTIANLGAGAVVALGTRSLTVDVAVRNLFDEGYASFLSRYKTYALDAGRNLVVRVATDW